MRKIAAPLLIASLVLSLAFLIYPMYVIRPFRHQGITELALSLWMLRYRPIVMVVCLVAGIASAFQIRRVPAIIGAVVIVGVAALSRINVFEKMFYPMGTPAVEAAQQSKLDGREMVIAVKTGGVARAYPIRIISYHHIANDTVGGVPIVATY